MYHCLEAVRDYRKVEHHIDTRGSRPVFARARRLAPDKLAVAKEESSRLLDMNIVRPSSNSPWSSPLHMVPNHSGGWRACGDYRALNAVSEDDRYPIPHMQDFAVNLIGRHVFSKVDMVRAYNQVPMNADDIAKTAIVTPFGLFEYLHMAFGLKNAALMFQRFMDNVFRDMQFVYVYLDDILVASSSTEEHCINLRQLGGIRASGEPAEMCFGTVKPRLSRPSNYIGWNPSLARSGASDQRLSSTTHSQVSEGIPGFAEFLQTFYATCSSNTAPAV